LKAWRTLSSKLVYDNPWFKVRRDQVLNHNNKELTYHVIDLKSPSVFILAFDTQNRLLLQRQYSYPIDQTHWGLPAGHSDGQELLAAAKRELLEETGMISNDWKKLGNAYSAIGIANMPAGIFVARNIRQITTDRDPDELITEQRFFTMEAVADLVKSGQLPFSAVLAALYLVTLDTAQGET
jgi:8-oxo-dGTP pyrophosphatase MutT (NUDIX family)